MKRLTCLLFALLLPLAALAEGLPTPEPIPTIQTERLDSEEYNGPIVTLTIAGSSLSYPPVEDLFDAEHPEIEVVSAELEHWYYDTGRLIDDMLTGNAQFDVIFISTEGIDLSALLNKGYAMPLTDSQVLVDEISAMWPACQQAVTSSDGLIRALPLHLFTSDLTYEPEVFARLGLSVPTTWAEFAALINDFPNQPEEVQEEYELCMWQCNYRQMFLRRMMEGYVTYLTSCGEETHFNTPLFRELMTLADTLTTANDCEEERDCWYLTTSGIDSFQTGYNSRSPLLLLRINDKAVCRTDVGVALINPYTRHPQEALAFLEYMAQHVSPEVRVTLYPEGNVPVERENWPATQAEWVAEKERLEKALENAAPADQAEARDALNAHLQCEESLEKYSHWALSQADIDAFAAVGPHLVLVDHDILTMTDNNGQFALDSVIERYLGGQLNMDQFIQVLEERAQMVLNEQK